MPSPVTKTLLILSAVICLQTRARGQELPLAIAEISRSEPVDFDKEIFPLLKRNCLACHHAKENEGGLVLESHKAMLVGGDSGPAVVAKDVDASRLLEDLTSEGPSVAK